MSSLPRPISLAAERAVRFLRDRNRPVKSVRLASELLATRIKDEAKAKQVLEAAFAGDSRLVYGTSGWQLTEPPPAPEKKSRPPAPEPDRVLVFVQGSKPGPGQSFELRSVSVLRLRGEEVVAACGGDTCDGPSSKQLRRAVVQNLEGAALVIHDPPGALKAFEAWLGEPVEAPISLRRLAQVRLGLKATHDLEKLAARLGLHWRGTGDPLDEADILDACLKALRRPSESLHDLRLATSRGARPIDWSRFAFDVSEPNFPR